MFKSFYAAAAVFATYAVATKIEEPEDYQLAQTEGEAIFTTAALIAAAIAGGKAAAAGAGAVGVGVAGNVIANEINNACFTYGTSVVRKAADGKSEAVPIEAVKEGDQVLVNSASGLHFTTAVAVDLHADSVSEVLTMTTRSGNHMTVTPEHLVPVSRAGK